MISCCLGYLRIFLSYFNFLFNRTSSSSSSLHPLLNIGLLLYFPALPILTCVYPVSGDFLNVGCPSGRWSTSTSFFERKVSSLYIYASSVRRSFELRLTIFSILSVRSIIFIPSFSIRH